MRRMLDVISEALHPGVRTLNDSNLPARPEHTHGRCPKQPLEPYIPVLQYRLATLDDLEAATVNNSNPKSDKLVALE